MKSNLFKLYATLMMAFVSFLSFADPIDPPADDDPPPAPINTKLIWLAVAGIIFVYFYFRKQAKTTSQN
ncbi:MULTISPECIES: hypothetical protein [unclassified Flavobacterium]|uniref:hypothetical protein n=1 Tax=unclassified Flavobacterium TaxID=196869 RepID=UPI0008BA5074|nr:MULTISPECIES: hypothetical protein [unclassified Flavobacterium]OGS62449.1 MAG: hypothetical protein A2X07_09640 [Flavobacteria bacterium GWF1_32_7]HBD27381.1 hypothetical protein [Flavobacterium sp.]